VLGKEREERDALLAQANAKLLELNTELAVVKTRLDETEEERGAIREQLAEFRQMTQQFRRMIDSGRLEVVFRRGRMIVQLPAQVLFPSGSADLTDDGRKSLGEVAKILRGLRNRRFVVAGHTDNVPIAKNEHFTSNWDLSSARAVNVTAALLLFRFRDGDANVRSVWLCSRNDAIGNVAVMLAALGVFGTGAAWPDLAVAAIMAGLFLYSAVTILRQSLGELRRANGRFGAEAAQ